MLRTKIAEVETALAECSYAARDSHTSTEIKRKRTSSPNRLANTQSKRTRLDAELAIDDTHHSEPESDERVPSLQELVSSSISRLSRSRTYFTEHHQRIDSIDLACQTLCHVVKSAVGEAKNHHRTDSGPLTLPEACRAARCIWALVSVVYLSLPGEELSTSDIALVQTSASGVFQCLLEKLNSLCLAEAQRRIEREDSRRTKSAANTKSNMHNATTDMQEFKSGCSAICSTIAVLLKLALDDQSRRYQILEIFFGILLDRIGSSIGIQLFVEATSDENDYGLATPPGLLGLSNLGPTVTLSATQIAAPYLTYLLKNFTPETAQNRGAQSKDDATNSLQKVLKEKMQNTLLQGIFGHNDETFSNALQRAAEFETKTRSQLQSVLKHDTSDEGRLIEEVWSHLGWDLLMQETVTTTS